MELIMSDCVINCIILLIFSLLTQFQSLASLNTSELLWWLQL